MLNFSKHLSQRAALNGLINALLLNLALDFSLSTYTENMAIEWGFVISAICALIGALAFMKLLPPDHSLTGTFAFLALSLITFIAAFLLLFCLPNTFPLRTTNNADGLLIMFLAMNFGLIAVIGRMIIIVSRIIKNRYEKE